MKKFLFSMIAVAMLAILSPVVKAQDVSASVPQNTLKKGKTVNVTVVLNIPDGLHVNSNRPKGDSLIATVVTPTGKGITFGKVIYPRGHDRTFGFSRTPLNVYEGRVTFIVPVTLSRSFQGSTAELRIAVRFQACTDDVCYPPKTRRISLSPTVR